MSAFIVSTDHIDYLITAACEAGIGGPGVYWDERGQGGDLERIDDANAERIGAALLAANVASVAYRYGAGRDQLPGPVPNPDPATYRFRAFPGIEPVQVLKALDCYAYQSCERPDWQGSPAARFVEALRARYVGQLPGYDAALWEVTRPELLQRAIIRRRHRQA